MNTNRDAYSTAIHEAGHSLAASHFKIPNFPELTPGGVSKIAEFVSPERLGICHLDEGPITPFQNAVISWAGIMAECLYGNSGFCWLPPFKPSAKLLQDWHSMLVQQIARLSDGDRCGILGYRDTWRSCKSAFAIVRKNRGRIIRLARALIGKPAEKAVPLPDAFPASREDFLRLVIAADDAAKRYDEFVSDSAKAFWAGYLENYPAALPMLKNHFRQFVTPEIHAAHPGKTAEDIAQILFDAAFQTAKEGERKRFERGLENQTGWAIAARKYRAWAKKKADFKTPISHVIANAVPIYHDPLSGSLKVSSIISILTAFKALMPRG